MILLVLLFLGCYINPSQSDYYNNINAIQKPDDPHHTTMDLFELTYNLFQNLNSYSGLINLESVPRMFTRNVVQSLSSSQTVVHVITLMSAQASASLTSQDLFYCNFPLFQLIFNTVGWYLTSLAWSSLRGGNVSWDPEFREALNNGLLSQDFAATNLAVGAGAVSSNNKN